MTNVSIVYARAVPMIDQILINSNLLIKENEVLQEMYCSGLYLCIHGCKRKIASDCLRLLQPDNIPVYVPSPPRQIAYVYVFQK